MKLMRYMILALIGLLAGTVSAQGAETLLLVDGQKQYEIPMDSIRELADVDFTIYAPFRGREVKMRGVFLEAFLEKQLSQVPAKIEFTAYDDYTLSFAAWKPEHWVLVTHEDGKPLSLRQQGPVRLVELDYGEKDPENLRNFNDWIWMIRSIEVIQ